MLKKFFAAASVAAIMVAGGAAAANASSSLPVNAKVGTERSASDNLVFDVYQQRAAVNNKIIAYSNGPFDKAVDFTRLEVAPGVFQFVFTPYGNDSGLCISDPAGGFLPPGANADGLVLRGCNNGPWQRFAETPGGADSNLKNVATGKFVQDNGFRGQLTGEFASNGPDQQWTWVGKYGFFPHPGIRIYSPVKFSFDANGAVKGVELVVQNTGNVPLSDVYVVETFTYTDTDTQVLPPASEQTPSPAPTATVTPADTDTASAPDTITVPVTLACIPDLINAKWGVVNCTSAQGVDAVTETDLSKFEAENGNTVNVTVSATAYSDQVTSAPVSGTSASYVK